MSEKSGMIIRPDEARVFRAFGEEVTMLLDGERTAGKFYNVDRSNAAAWRSAAALPPERGGIVSCHQRSRGISPERQLARSQRRRNCVHAARRRSHVQERQRSI